MPFQDPSGAADPVELDINGNPIPAKNLFAAPAPADAAPPEKTPTAPSSPATPLRPLSGDARPGLMPRPGVPDSAETSSGILGTVSGHDLAGNPLPGNAPPPGGGLYAPQPNTGRPGAERGAAPHGIDPTGGAGYGRRYKTTVNGGLILGLGVGGLVFWPLASVAWVMGNNAVSAIKRGDANSAPLGQANAGRLCGIIGTTLLVLALGAYAVYTIVKPTPPSPLSAGDAPPAAVSPHTPAHVPAKAHHKHHK